MGFYFRELPNIEYSASFKNRRNIDEYTLAKNIFRRPVLRDDLANSVTAFTQYEIRDNERDKKNYEVSDLIRDKLSKLGININDKQ